MLSSNNCVFSKYILLFKYFITNACQSQLQNENLTYLSKKLKQGDTQFVSKMKQNVYPPVSSLFSNYISNSVGLLHFRLSLLQSVSGYPSSYLSNQLLQSFLLLLSFRRLKHIICYSERSKFLLRFRCLLLLRNRIRHYIQQMLRFRQLLL